MRKYIYHWFDGDVKHYYFSNKKNLMKFVGTIAREHKDLTKDPRSIKQIMQNFSNALYVCKESLDQY